MRRGFTLLELVAAMAIIAVLAGLIMGGVGVARRSAERTGTKALIGVIAASIVSYSQRHFDLWADGAADPVTSRAWDADRDGVLDGIVEPAMFWRAVPAASALGAGPIRERSRYRGFAATVAPPGLRGIREPDLAVLDTWKRPLMISWAAGIYGDEGFCVWSHGADPLDPQDNILSREPR